MGSPTDKANVWMRSAEGAELNDAIASVLVHELGGVAGALDLRATALSRTIPPNDVAALRGLAEEIRASTRAARLLRGADASGILNPGREQSLADWWRLASRLTRVVLPKTTAVDASFEDCRLSADASRGLTWIWLAACKDLAELLPESTASVTLRGGIEGETISLRADSPGHSAPTAESRWARHAKFVASGLGARDPIWKAEGGVVSWLFSLPGTPVPTAPA